MSDNYAELVEVMRAYVDDSDWSRGRDWCEKSVAAIEALLAQLPEGMKHCTIQFKECAKGKLPGAWLVSRADGGQWRKEAWRDEIKLAAAGAKLPKATVAYTLRHSVITDLVKGGLDLFHVAKLAGTSILMIEKHYGQLQNEHAREALKRLSLA